MLAQVEGLSRPPERVARVVEWVVPTVGVARAVDGQIEVFLAGAPLAAALPVVQQALVHGEWVHENGEVFAASRLLLPPFGHFDQVAAFIVTELVRRGAEHDLTRAFTAAEPIIALALEPLRSGQRALLGLVGELRVLRTLMLTARHPIALPALWWGADQTARDFQLGAVGVEVKTTTREVSSHEVSGPHQVEVGHGVGGVPETSLRLVSLGLRPGGESGSSLPLLVDQIVDSLARGGAPEHDVDEFLRKVAAYGGGVYDHRDEADRLRYRFPFELRFARGYDMTDEAIKVLGTDDIRACPHVEAGSVRFRVNLPAQVRGDVNPVTGLAAIARAVLTDAGLTDAER